MIPDLFVRHVYCRMGAFAQPFFGKEEVRSRWGAHFEFDTFENLKSILYFRGTRGVAEPEAGRVQTNKNRRHEENG